MRMRVNDCPHFEINAAKPWKRVSAISTATALRVTLQSREYFYNVESFVSVYKVAGLVLNVLPMSFYRQFLFIGFGLNGIIDRE